MIYFHWCVTFCKWQPFLMWKTLKRFPHQITSSLLFSHQLNFYDKLILFPGLKPAFCWLVSLLKAYSPPTVAMRSCDPFNPRLKQQFHIPCKLKQRASSSIRKFACEHALAISVCWLTGSLFTAIKGRKDRPKLSPFLIWVNLVPRAWRAQRASA